MGQTVWLGTRQFLKPSAEVAQIVHSDRQVTVTPRVSCAFDLTGLTSISDNMPALIQLQF